MRICTPMLELVGSPYSPQTKKACTQQWRSRIAKNKYNLWLFSHWILSNSLQPHRLQHTSLPSLSLCPGVCSNSCPLSWWCHTTISSSVIPFSSCLQSFPASRYFPLSWLFQTVGQSVGASASASVLAMNIHYRFPLGLIGLISLLSRKGTLKSFSSITIQKYQFFSA